MAMELVAEYEIGSGGAASIEFTSIPQDGVDLLLVVSPRNTSTSFDIKPITFNGDTGTNYSSIMLTGSGSGVVSTSEGPTDRTVMRALTKSTDTSNTFGSGSMYISNYTSSATKSISVDTVTENNSTAVNTEIRATSYTGTSAITSILLDTGVGNFGQYSTASLYKIY